MSNGYEHEGRLFNKPVIRDILTNLQPPPQVWTSIEDLVEMTLQYHLRHGGDKPRMLSSYGPTREVLVDLYDVGQLERKRYGNRVKFRSPPQSEMQDDELTVMFRLELERVVAEIEPLLALKAELEAVIEEIIEGN